MECLNRRLLSLISISFAWTKCKKSKHLKGHRRPPVSVTRFRCISQRQFAGFQIMMTTWDIYVETTSNVHTVSQYTQQFTLAQPSLLGPRLLKWSPLRKSDLNFNLLYLFRIFKNQKSQLMTRVMSFCVLWFIEKPGCNIYEIRQ